MRQQTVFVTDPAAADKLRLFQGDCGTESTGFVVMSDGCAESLYDKKTRQPAAGIAKLLAWNQQLSRKKADRILATNLKQAFSQKSTDDCALALLSVSAAG